MTRVLSVHPRPGVSQPSDRDTHSHKHTHTHTQSHTVTHIHTGGFIVYVHSNKRRCGGIRCQTKTMMKRETCEGQRWTIIESSCDT